MKRALVIAFLMVATTAVAQERASRTYAGGFSSRWKTLGLHGHDQEWCGEPVVVVFPGVGFGHFSPDCNAMDFARANLDNAIGVRGGIERDLWGRGLLRLVGGAEGGLSFTEYNLTQADFVILSGSLIAGFDFARWGGRLGGRYGAGPSSISEGDMAFNTYTEVVAQLPLRPGAAVRFSQRHSRTTRFGRKEDGSRDTARALETSVMFVASPETTGSSRWEFSTSTGSSTPGGGPWRSLQLREAPYFRLTADRDLPWWDDTALQISWTSTGHESRLPTVYRGYDGNFRSKTISGFGLGIQRVEHATGLLSLTYGGGIEVADWRDDHHLLIDRRGETFNAGVETAFHASGGLRYQFSPHTAVEVNIQQLVWTGLALGERRWGIGFVLTR